MKKIKLVFWLIIIALLCMVIYQNQTYLLAKNTLSLEIPFINNVYHLPAMPNGLFFVACMLIGFIFAYFLSILGRFKDSKKIKSQKATIKSHIDTISGLKKEVQLIKDNIESESYKTTKQDINDKEPQKE